MCELIGRVDADPDVLPRTENFGLDYIAFSAMCPSCPPDFLKLTYNCVKVRILPQNSLFLSFKDTSIVQSSCDNGFWSLCQVLLMVQKSF